MLTNSIHLFPRAVLLAMALVLSCGLAACSEREPDGVDGSSAAQMVEANENAAVPQGDAVDMGRGVAIEKCVFLKRSAEPTIAITYSFENPHDFEIPFDAAVLPEVTQNGAKLPSSYADAGMDSSATAGTQGVAPGERIEVEKVYALSGGEDVNVSCTVIDPDSGERVLAAARTFSVKEEYAAFKKLAE